MQVRHRGARLAVPLIIIPLLVGIAWLLTSVPVRADDGCVLTPSGIDCGFRGSTTSTSVVVVTGPYRYLRMREHPTVGTCWQWYREPPGWDRWNWSHSVAITVAQRDHPECPAWGWRGVSVSTRAWAIFRSFPLAGPIVDVRPSIGIANLATVIAVGRPAEVRHRERLPDGRMLEVRAAVETVRIDWGDGATTTVSPGEASGAGVLHAYALKTCNAAYRRSHPSGRNCHPTLDSYPIGVVLSWRGRYSTGGAWTNLGTLNRSTTFRYDVDEVVGIPVAP